MTQADCKTAVQVHLMTWAGSQLFDDLGGLPVYLMIGQTASVFEIWAG